MSHDTVAEATFTRNSVASRKDSTLTIQLSDSASARDSHFLDLGTKSLLLEGQSANDWNHSEEIDNAVWDINSVVKEADSVAGPDNTTNADKVREDATTSTQHLIFRDFLAAPTDDTKSTVSFFIKDAGEIVAGKPLVRLALKKKDGVFLLASYHLSTGVFSTVSAGLTMRDLGTTINGFRRISATYDVLSGGSTPQLQIQLNNGVSYNGDNTNGIYLWGMQQETNLPFASSYIPTVNGGVIRFGDKISWPLTLVPQAMTIYVRFIECGSILVNSARVLQIGLIQNADPRVGLTEQNGTGEYQFFYDSGSGTVTSRMGTSPSIGDVVELRGVLFASGAVQCHQSINGVAETSAPKSAAEELASAWSAQLIWLGSIGGANVGFNAFQAVKIVPGVQTLSYMRGFGTP